MANFDDAALTGFDDAKQEGLERLAELVKEDYERRRNGSPDKWFWADALLLELGYTVTLYGKLVSMKNAEHCMVGANTHD